MGIETANQFTEDQIALARKVDRWTVRAEGEAWFAAQVMRARDLHDQHLQAMQDWREDCRRRVLDLLRDGRLEERRPERGRDERNAYSIEVSGSPAMKTLAQQHSESLTKAEASKLRRALLTIVEDPKGMGQVIDHGFYRRERRTSRDARPIEFLVWISLPDRPADPLMATGFEFAKLSRSEQVAIAATFALSVHARVMPEYRRVPQIDDRVFAFSMIHMAEDDERDVLGSLNLIEADLPAEVVAHDRGSTASSDSAENEREGDFKHIRAPRVDLETCSIVLNGERLYFATERQAELARDLETRAGIWQTSAMLASIEGERIDRLRDGMPKQVQRCIESKRGRGFRWIEPLD